MPRKPLICLTVRGKPLDPSRQDMNTAAFEWITKAFGSSITSAGGVPILLSNECPPEEVARIVHMADALFLTGGEDVAPEHFGETASVDNMTIDPMRDAVDLAAIAAADQVGMPIMGVCRGIQVLNVARGGSIYQDLLEQYPTTPRDHSRGPSRVEVQTHAVVVEENSRLAQILGTDRLDGATDHHQALRDIGRDLVVSARSPEDHVIEAVEETGDRFVVAVQWHPEVRPDDDVTTRLFDAFVNAAVAYAAARKPDA